MSIMTSTSIFPCFLCPKTYDTKKKLQCHERNKKNSKLISFALYWRRGKVKRIFKYDEITFCEDINTSTRITFSWIQKECKENNR
ncbi:hypothetical protein C2G38_2066870, partial [Gigaspora rosea]